MSKATNFINFKFLLRIFLSLYITVLFSYSLFGQGFYFQNNKNKQTLNFKLVKNLIVIELLVNNKGPYNFLLDTGVGVTLITNPNIIDSLDYNKLRKIKVTGLGLEQIDAFITNGLSLQVGRAKVNKIPITILKEDLFNLSGYLGINIEGIIGYSLFRSFYVNIDYSNEQLKLYKLDSKKKFKGEKIPISIQNLKPYTSLDILFKDGQRIKGNFLIDNGASHALSLENISIINLPKPNIKANLGMSISGEIKGHLARVEKVNLGKFEFNNVVSSFPDSIYVKDKIEDFRQGNIGAEILRRFNTTFDYLNEVIYLKPNQYYKKSFEYDMVGATIYYNKNVNKYYISELDEDSPADKSGLLLGDQVISINFLPIASITFNEIVNIFKSSQGKKILIKVLRNSEAITFIVELEKRI